MDNSTYLMVGAFYNLAFAIFHAFFGKIFKWDKQLRLLNFVNKGIIRILNLCLILVFLFFFYISFFHTIELTSTKLGLSTLLFISLFWFIRALEQIYFYGLKNRISLILFLIFIFGGLIYLRPILIKL
jgi:hypothetical protein